MAIEIRVPTLGESVTEATIGQWYKKPGDAVSADEPLVELETDKVALEVNAPSAGVLESIVAETGTTVEVGALIASLGGEGAAATPAADAKPEPEAAAPAPAANGEIPPSPAAEKLMAETGLTPADIKGTGKHGQISQGRRAQGRRKRARRQVRAGAGQVPSPHRRPPSMSPRPSRLRRPPRPRRRAPRPRPMMSAARNG